MLNRLFFSVFIDENGPVYYNCYKELEEIG